MEQNEAIKDILYNVLNTTGVLVVSHSSWFFMKKENFDERKHLRIWLLDLF